MKRNAKLEQLLTNIHGGEIPSIFRTGRLRIFLTETLKLISPILFVSRNILLKNLACRV
jgi:hypothetical protein